MASISFGGLTLGGGGGPVLPGKFTSPINTGPQSPTGALPLGTSGNSPFTSAQQSQLQNALSAAGIWDTISGLGGDIWGTISKILPKNADGSIDWGGALKDVGSWVKDNKSVILDGLNAYNSYQRSQKSDEYAKKALDLATQSYAAKQPLRDAGQAGMLDPKSKAPDISALTLQGQNGLKLSAPTPLPLATGGLNNAAQIAGGPTSANPFTKALPLATAPGPVAPPVGAPPTLPIAPLRKAPTKPLY